MRAIHLSCDTPLSNIDNNLITDSHTAVIKADDVHIASFERITDYQ